MTFNITNMAYNKKEIFIEKAIKKHGNKYDYSITEYINSEIKIKFICPFHGVVEQTPATHLRTCGCPKCGKTCRKDFDYFLKKANKIHNYKYSYKKFEYINKRQKIDIICPIHGKFTQSIDSHLNKHGCYKCGVIATHQNKITKIDFIKKSKMIHKNKYNYSFVDFSKYKNNTHKVLIYCKEHGFFYQSVNQHVAGHGCSICGKNKAIDKKEFLNRTNKIFGDLYDYSSIFEINNSKDIINVICKKHGPFRIKVFNHIRGSGCPHCILKSQTILYNKLKKEINEEFLFEVNKLTIPWIGLQRFDIYMPKYNIAIEYNGVQHYKPVKAFGGKENFLIRNKKDEQKRKLCKENNCFLFEVKYDYTEDDFKQLVLNINNIINDFKFKQNEIN